MLFRSVTLFNRVADDMDDDLAAMDDDEAEEKVHMKLPPSSYMKNTIKSANENSKIIYSTINGCDANSVHGINSNPSVSYTRRSDKLKMIQNMNCSQSIKVKSKKADAIDPEVEHPYLTAHNSGRKQNVRKRNSYLGCNNSNRIKHFRTLSGISGPFNTE